MLSAANTKHFLFSRLIINILLICLINTASFFILGTIGEFSLSIWKISLLFNYNL